MKRLISLLLILTMAVLVACTGDATETETTTDDTDTSSETTTTTDTTPEITYTITGATDASGEGNVNIFCDDGDGVFEQFFEVGYLGIPEQLNLTLMSDASGTVDLIGSDDDGANPGQANYVEYTDAERVSYELGSGQLVIDNFPTSAGENFVATLTAELSDEEGNTINVEASYDVATSSSTFEDCPSE